MSGDNMEESDLILSEQWKCKYCDTQLTSQIYYDRHQGSKKHKRNVRSARKVFYERGFTGQVVDASSSQGDTSSPLTAEGASEQHPLESHLIGISDYKSERENYRQKNNKNFEEYYTTYVSSIIAYWAINLALNPTIQDFKISTNDKNWDDFGDAVVEINFKELPEKRPLSIRCAVHFKQIVSHTVKSLDSFSEGKFSFEGITRQIGKIRGKKEEELEDTRFYVFTTSAPSPSLQTSLKVSCCNGCCKPAVTCKCPLSKYEDCDCQSDVSVFAKTLSNRRNLVLNTSEDNESVYRFFPQDNSYSLPGICIYTCQKKMRDYPRAIEEMVSDSFGEKPVQIAKDFIKYIENWAKGKCGGFYKLKKEDVLVKLGHLLLDHLRVTPEVKDLIEPASRFAIWIQAIKSVDITVLKFSTDLSIVLEPFNLLIEKQLSLKINTTDDTIKIIRTRDYDHTRILENPILRAYLFEETLRDFENDIPLEKLYTMFWKAGLMPLVLQVGSETDQNYVFNVVSVLKGCGLIRRYLVKIKEPNPTRQIAMKNLRPLSFFVNLSDISNKLGPSILSHIRIGVSDNFSISLADIEKSDVFFKKTVCASEFFDMVLGKYVFKQYNNGIGQREDQSTKLTLASTLMNKFRHEVESRGDVALVRERTESELVINKWLHGVDPDLFL